MYPINTLFILNVHNVISQLYLNKSGKKRNCGLLGEAVTAWSSLKMWDIAKDGM